MRLSCIDPAYRLGLSGGGERDLPAQCCAMGFMNGRGMGASCVGCVILAGALAFAASVSTRPAAADIQPAPTMGYTVVARFPHSMASYTEGFFYLDGLFYEGTGLEGHSAVLAIQPETGKVVRKVELAPEYFGEGIVDWGASIYEWTWTSHICFVYERATFRRVKQLSYTGEGWGMTRTKEQIVTSDGSANLTFRDPETFSTVRTITVHDGLAVVESSMSWSLSRVRSTRISGTRIKSRAPRRTTGT